VGKIFSIEKSIRGNFVDVSFVDFLRVIDGWNSLNKLTPGQVNDKSVDMN